MKLSKMLFGLSIPAMIVLYFIHCSVPGASAWAIVLLVAFVLCALVMAGSGFAIWFKHN